MTNMNTTVDVSDAEKVLKALANARRLRVVKYLKHHKQAAVGELAEHIKLSIKSTSHHLRIMFSAGVVERNQTSTTVFYRLRSRSTRLLEAVLLIL